jgi:hypothetical protein
MNYLVLLLAALCLATSVFSAVVSEDIRELRQEFQQRQSNVNESASYKDLNNKMINALANIAASAGDEAIREMLSSEGVTYELNNPPEAVAAPQAEGEANDG